MAGKPKLELYQYSSEYKYLRSYESQQLVFDKYYDCKNGKLFYKNRDYRLLPDGTYICKYRMGRFGLRLQVMIDNDPYCKEYKDDFPIEVFNRKGVKVAEFLSVRVCSEMTGLSYNEVFAKVQYYSHHPTKAKLRFKKK